MKKLHRLMSILTVAFGILIGGLLLTGNTVFAASKAELDDYRLVFDANYYAQTYPDVAASCGNNFNALLVHYANNGAKEGRDASAEFNVQAYRARYQDLQQCYGENLSAYCRHYAIYGKAENRDGRSEQQIAKGEQNKSANSSSMTGNSSVNSVEMTVIGSYTTLYNAKIPRATNVELAAQNLNGTIVAPGEEFSYSKTILPRTTANGYVMAPIFINKEHGMGIGGGICQTSSTLYAALLSAGLPATERHPHSLPVTYIPAGMDATISGTALDLKFVNIYEKPLLIEASASGGTLTISLKK